VKSYVGVKVWFQLLSPVALTPEGETPSTHCIEGAVGPSAGLDTVVRSCPRRESNLKFQVVQTAAKSL
jgi:hypothetical protein